MRRGFNDSVVDQKAFISTTDVVGLMCFCFTCGSDGSVYVWGSGSYNEHGTGVVGGQDLVDRLYYYTPRRVMNLPAGVKIVSPCRHITWLDCVRFDQGA